MINRRLNTVSRHVIGPLVHKDFNYQVALRIFANNIAKSH